MTQKEILTAYKEGKLSKEQLQQMLSELNGQSFKGTLSEGQKGLWMLQKMSPEMSAYNVPICLRLFKKPDPEKFQKACRFLLAQYPILGSLIEEEKGLPHRTEQPAQTFTIQQQDLTDLDDEAVTTLLREKVKEPFVLNEGPLLRVHLLTRSENEWIVLIVVHHIIFDGSSTNPLVTTLLDAYSELVQGNIPVVKPLPATYNDFAQWEGKMLNSDEGKEHREYWKQQLGGSLPTMELHTDHPRTSFQMFEGKTATKLIDPELSETIRSAADKWGMNPSILFLAVYKLLLHRYTAQEDIIVGMPTMGRPDERYDNLIGYFINMVAIRSVVESGQTFSDLLEKLQLNVVDGLDHAAYPFPAIVRDLNVPRTEQLPPVFQVYFAYQNFVQADGLQGFQKRYESTIPFEFVDDFHQEGEYEMELEVFERENQFLLYMKYNPELFESETIERMIGHYLKLIESVTKNPELPIGTYPMLSEQEENILLHDWNQTDFDYPAEFCMHELFEQQAELSPNAIAATFENRSLTYRELDEKSTTLALYLQAEGVQPDQLIGICVERSLDMIVGLLGIMKAGAAYVPLDPEYPTERLEYMIQDSQSTLLLTQSRLMDKMSALVGKETKAIILDDWESISKHSNKEPQSNANGNSNTTNENRNNQAVNGNQNNPEGFGKDPIGDQKTSEGSQRDQKTVLQREVKPGHLAYVIYTSGSTGNPKGVMISHQALVNFLVTMGEKPGLNDKDKMLAVTTYCFDITGLELFLPLIKGAECVICSSEKAKDAAKLKQEIGRVQPSIMQATPATWTMLFGAGWKNEENTKVLCGGEALPEMLKQKFLESNTDAWNMFGPTETTVWSTIQQVNAEDRITIGKPIANTQIYILDKNDKPTPIGVPGELCIAGDGLARGYLNREELTAEKFIENPLKKGTKLYRVGDLARWLPNGNIEFLGRLDHQVKIRGYRIELGEIESQLGLYPEIKDCAVIVKEQNGHKQLIAYYLPKDLEKYREGESAIDPAKLRDHLKENLPDHMIPAIFTNLDELPLTPNGKKNRKALTARKVVLTRAAKEAPKKTKTAKKPQISQSVIEEKVLAIWEEVLNIGGLSTEDGFFDVGGDSVLAVTVTEQIKSALNCDLNVTNLFKYSNIGELSEYITQQLEPATEEEETEVIETSTTKHRNSPYPEYYQNSLAIIGISCHLPGAKDYKAFWENLTEGKESVQFFTKEELEGFGVPKEISEKPNFIGMRSSIDGKELFDPEFFSISARDAEFMDPQFRLLLLHAWKAVEDAGYRSSQIPETGVYISASNSIYQALLPHALAGKNGVMENPDEYVSWVLAQGGTIPTMISHKLGLKGSSYFVHSNCSSALIGLHAAYQSLNSGEAEYALVGASTIAPGNNYGYLHQFGLNLSGDGHLKPFDSKADGMVSGEGVAVILVKQAMKAIEDGDHIYSLIRGVGINNDGADKVGFYAPSIKGQASVIQKTLKTAEINPETINYVEAHGTGTKLGDPIEVAALTDVYQQYTDKKQFCGIGSVKSNIGHLDTAAGLAGCIKIALSLYHGELPPSINFEEPNPNIDLESSPFYVVTERQKWKKQQTPNRAALSSFGIGGTNGHTILEQFVPAESESIENEQTLPVPISAKNSERLKAYAHLMRAFLIQSDKSPTTLGNLAYTLQVGRETMESRVCFLVKTAEELIQKLTDFIKDVPNIADAFQAETETDKKRKKESRQWQNQDEVKTIAELWTKGVTIDWTPYYAGSNPKRIALPTYPFAEESYWVPELKPDANGGQVALPTTMQLHPLLHRNTSDFSEQRFSSLFTGQEFFLADHLVQNQRVLPGVAYLEMARAAVEQAVGDLEEAVTIRLKNVVWVQPVVVTKTPNPVHITLIPEENETISYEIFSETNSTDTQPTLHCQGSAELNETTEIPKHDLTALQAECDQKAVSARECYDFFSAMGIDYGPGHRGVESIHVGQNKIVAKLNLPESVTETAEQYLLHPSLMDSAFQSTIGLMMTSGNTDDFNRTFLPFALRDLQIFSLCTDEVWVVIQYSAGSSRSDKVQKVDIDLCDPSGAVCVRMKEFSSRALETTDKKANANELIGTMPLAPVWEVVNNVPWQKPTPEDGKRLLMVTTSRLFRQMIQSQYPDVIDLGLQADDWIETIAEKIKTVGAFDHIIFAAPDGDSFSIIDERVILDQEQGSLLCFRLIKALIQLGYDTKQLTWTVITEQAQQICSNDEILPTHASLYGLIGSMAKEFNNWKVRLIDFEMGTDWQLKTLFSLPFDPAGNPWGYRNGEWYREQMVPCTIPETDTTPYSEGATYVVIGGAGGIGEVWSESVIKSHQAQVIWIGRRAEDEAIQQKIERLAKLGPAPRYIQADATNRESMRSAYNTIKSEFGNVHGVVHSAIVLQDKTLAGMDDEQFDAAFSIKVDATVLIAQTFRQEPLDFVLFFSSMSAFSRDAGQSNYAAGSTFKDAFAKALNNDWPNCAVKTINWSYWGSVGVVSSDRYRERMAQMGIGSIEPPEAMETLNKLFASPLQQIGLVKTTKPLELKGKAPEEQITIYDRTVPAKLTTLADENPSQMEKINRVKEIVGIELNDMEAPLATLLWAQLHKAGMFQSETTTLSELKKAVNLPDLYDRWLEESVAVLTRYNYLRQEGETITIINTDPVDGETLWREWEKQKQPWLKNNNIKATVNLVEITLKALPEILSGKQPATDVIFPDSSLKLVEGLYKNNVVADYFNEVLADTLAAYVQKRIEEDQTTKIRILEIGAGTGGTSSVVFPKLRPYESHIAEYCYTDLSKAFLLHAEKEYGPENPYLTYKIFNAGSPIAEQDIEAGAFDVVIATNVLHATPNIRTTLRNAKAALAKNGLILLNELNSNTLFSHLIFGLLEGWWLYEDPALRIPGNPGLYPKTWQRVLTCEGFRSVFFPAHEANDLGQQIIVAESDGIVRQKVSSLQSTDHKADELYESEIEQPTELPATNEQRSTGNDQSVTNAAIKAKCTEYIKKLVAKTLRMPVQKIDAAALLEKYGIDSILVVQLTNDLREHFDDISSTLFFEYQTINALVDHFIETRKEALINLLDLKPTAPVVAKTATTPKAKKTIRKIVGQAGVDENQLRDKSTEYIKKLIAETLRMPVQKIDTAAPLEKYGIDSILVVQLTNDLRENFDDIGSTLFFEYQTINALVDHFMESRKEALIKLFGLKEESEMEIEVEVEADIETSDTATTAAQPRKISAFRKSGRFGTNRKVETNATPEPSKKQEIAIIGLAGQYAQATNTNEYWNNLKEGKNCITEIPADRWDWQDYYDEEKGKLGTIYTKWGGFLKEIDKFDPLFFQLSPLDGEGIDPQGRLFLETAYETIEDAGYTPENISENRRVGVYVGVMNANYISGTNYWGIANRVSWLFNFQGPSMAVDTACSASLTAIHLALDSIQTGLSDIALAGGVNLIVDPVHYQRLTALTMLSPSDQCKSFGEQADGFVDGEGVGAVLLKPLNRAIEDGDQIYGVIKGSMLNSGGKTNGFTVPNPTAQYQLIAEAFQRSNVNARTISYIEAHGTGTALGDPIEIAGLTRAFEQQTKDRQFCAIGSSKSNIGHCESAAGIGGLTKVLLQLKHKQLVPSLHSKTLNANIDFSRTPFVVQQNTETWKRPVVTINGESKEYPRIAGISSFGAGGGNAHLVVEEYIETREQYSTQADENPPFLIVLSAKKADRLKERAKRLLSAIELQQLNNSDLPSMAYTLQTGREAMNNRLALTVFTIEELTEKLNNYLADDSNVDELYLGDLKKNQDALSAFATDEDMGSIVDLWIAKGKYAQLLDLWTKGLDFDWNKLYSAQKPIKMSLPTYPFARERYWMDELFPNIVGTSGRSQSIDMSEGIGTLITTPTKTEKTVIPVQQSETFRQRLVVLCDLKNIAANTITTEISGCGCLVLNQQEKEPAERYQSYAIELLTLIRKIFKENPTGKTLLQLLLPANPEKQWLLGLSGLLKSAQMENPKLAVQLITIEENETESAIVEKLRNDALTTDTEIHYQNGKRLVTDWQELTTPTSYTHPWKESGVYLITGGAGGLGLLFAKEISEQVKNTTLILTGRSPINPAKEQQLESLRAFGATVEYSQVDVTDKQAVKQLIESIQNNHGQLNGIIHSAGVVKDNFILNKSEAELNAVLAPKVAGVINLDEATAQSQLDLFVLFSSTGALGNPGQADYAAANAFMDHYAICRNKKVAAGERKGQTLAINWPLWKEGGMKMDETSELMIHQNLGMIAMRTKSGIKALYRALASGYGQVMVMEGEVAKMRQLLFATATEQVVEQPTEAIAETSDGSNGTIDETQLKEKALQKIKALFGEEIRMAAHRVDAEEPFESYGIDSILIAKLNQKLEAIFGEISKTLFFQFQTLSELNDHLVEEHREAAIKWTGITNTTKSPTASKFGHVAKISTGLHQPITEARRPLPITEGRRPLPPSDSESVAIIGISGRYPQAKNLDAYWNNLKAGKDCVTEIPADRWPMEGFFHPDMAEASAQGKSYSKWGGFVDDFDRFDPLFFKLSPRETVTMDPQERLFILSCWEVLEDAGYTRNTLSKRYDNSVGVFAGVTKTGFDLYGPDLWRDGQQVHPHTSFSSLANRVSWLLNLKGPSMPIDTMCSSSLTAIHEACEHLKREECELAIAGGVNLYLHPSNYIGLCSLQMLSIDGQCKSFGKGGNGFVPGEGVGTVLLKRLSQAIEDRDNIHAIIRGTAINHGGRTNGYTVPSPTAQGTLIRKALDKAGVNAGTVSYIEAHGTGTKLGDPIEISGLELAFRKDTDKTGFCAIGSAKSNMGHLEAAAGIAGLTKIVLQMKHKTLVPTLHAKELNPNINFGKSPFVVQQEASEWKQPEVTINGITKTWPRIAGISSFGAGGSNAHIVLEEYIGKSENQSLVTNTGASNLFVLSAKNEERLKVAAENLLLFLNQSPTVNPTDLAYTLQVGREAMEERLALIADSVDTVKEKLSAFIAGQDGSDLYQGQAKGNQDTIALFAADEDMEKTIEAWITKGKETKFLELWVKGLSFDWAKLYENQIKKPRKISLPTYPFAQNRYWLPEVKQKKAAANNRTTSAMHPLLHENSSDLFGLRYSSLFTGEEFFLADHVVNGQPILPGVAYLEKARAAVERAAEAMTDEPTTTILKNVVWTRPIAVNGTEKLVDINLALEEDEQISWEVYSHENDNEPLQHSQGLAQLKPWTEAPTLDLSTLLAQCGPETISGEQCYELFALGGIVYGPGHRGIQTIRKGTDYVLAQIALPNHLIETKEQFGLHPALMDSAFQATLALTVDFNNTNGAGTAKPALPFALQHMEIFDQSSSEMWALIRFSPGSTANDRVRKLDLDLCDPTGKVFAQLRGFASRVLGDDKTTTTAGTKNTTKSETKNSLLLSEPVWNDTTFTAKTGENGEQRLIVICEPIPELQQALTPVETDSFRLIMLNRLESQIEQRFRTYATALLEEFQQLFKKKQKAVVQLILPADGEAALLAGLSGMLKTAKLENPKLTTQLVLIDPMAAKESDLESRLKIFAQNPDASEIRLQNGTEQVAGWQEIIPGAETPLPWKNDGVYLITGGAGGLGRIFAGEIAKTVDRATLILTGRSPLKPDVEQELNSLKRKGLTVEYRQMDVTNAESVMNLFQSARQQYGDLNGIIHSAGVIRDNFIFKKKAEELAMVLAPKVAGTVNLDRASEGMNLDFFVLFSSIAGSLGNFGQADYSSANAFMDHFAAYRNNLVSNGERTGKTVSINWPLWKSGGMHIDEESEKMMSQNTGMIPMRTETGIPALAQALAYGKSQVMVMEGDTDRIRKGLITKTTKTTTTTVDNKNKATTETINTQSESTLNHSVPSSDSGTEQLTEIVESSLKQAVSQLLQVNIEDIDPEAELNEYGFDSISLTELANKLNKEYKLELAPTLFFEHPTLNSITEYLVTEHSQAFGVVQQSTVEVPQAHQTEQGSLPPGGGLGGVTPNLYSQQPSNKGDSNKPEVHPTEDPVSKQDNQQNQNSTTLLEKVEPLLIKQVSDLLQVPTDDVDPEADLNEYGFDSISLTELANKLNKEYKLELTPTLFFEHATLRAITEYLVEEYSETFTARFPTETAAIVEKVVNLPKEPTDFVQVTATPAVPTATTKTKPIRRRKATRFAKATPTTSTKVEKQTVEPVAIVGISGRFPMAEDVNEFWKNLSEGKDCIQEIPADRWDWKEYYGDPNKEANKTNIKWGGFIDGLGEFDPFFFGISPREAQLMDPQQRLLMTYVWKAVEDAGYSSKSLAGTSTAIFVGTAMSGYMGEIAKTDTELEGYSSTGLAPSVGPNRMSFFLNIHGPSEPIETACSSSLVAIHRAMLAMETGNCDAAIVGGVNSIIGPDVHISFNKAGMLCEDGRCKTFSNKANGYVRGEGVGMLFLKKLSAAEADGDHIYGLLIGSAENHGGRANSLTAPNPKAQAELLKAAYTKAGIDPRTVSYIEAHGTGTELGDPIEINGLKSAFKDLYQMTGESTVNNAHCGLGSVKSNIGHLELSAGVAGVIKVLMQLKHKQLVKTLHCDEVNPYIQLEKSPFRIVKENQDWTPIQDAQGNELPRRAGVSSFGFGGANAHVVIEEYRPNRVEKSKTEVSDQNPAIILLSAKTEEQLNDQAVQLLQAVESGNYTNADLADIAYTLQIGRDMMEERLALIVTDIEALKKKLQDFIKGKKGTEKLYRGKIRKNKDSVASFGTDEDMALAIDSWVAKGKFPKMLDLWVRGLNYDWNKLHGIEKPRRISLPTYPFSKERYWVPSGKGNGKRTNTAEGGMVTNALHPLLHQNRSGFSEQRFRSIFTGNEFFLNDHRVHNERVLPGVAYTELARAAVMHSVTEVADEQVGLKLKNIIWARPFVVGEQSKELQISLIPEENGNLAWEVYGKMENTKDVAIHCQGRAQIVELPESPSSDLAVLRSTCDQKTIPAETCYQQFETMGLNYGPAFRGIQQLLIGENQVLAELKLPVSAMAESEQLKLHPTMMDAALQAVIGLSLAEKADDGEQKAVLPYALQEIEIFSQCEETMTAHVRYAEGSTADDKIQKIDIDLYNETGTIAVRIKGFSSRVLEGTPKQTTAKSNRSITKQTAEKQKRVAKTTSGKKDLNSAVKEYLTETIADAVKLAPEKIDEQTNFERYGIDSLLQMDLIREFEAITGELSGTLLFEYSNIEELAEYFLEEHKEAFTNKLLPTEEETQTDEETGMEEESEVADERSTLEGAANFEVTSILKKSQDYSPLEGGRGVLLSNTDQNREFTTPFKSSTNDSPLERAGREADRGSDSQQGIAPIELQIRTKNRATEQQTDNCQLITDNRRTKSDHKGRGVLLSNESSDNDNRRWGKELSKSTLNSEANSNDDNHKLSKSTLNSEVSSKNEGAVNNQPIDNIAIIGVSGRYPKSDNLNELWENLKAGENCIGKLPENRRRTSLIETLTGESMWKQDRTYFGGFLNDIDQFDHQWFEMNTEQAMGLSPEHRLFMETVRETIENAGYDRESLQTVQSRSKEGIGLFVGTMYNQYSWSMTDPKHALLNTNGTEWQMANRTSHFFNLTGPSMAINTACSSALTAIHLACESLKQKSCSMAIAGGVNLTLDSSKYEALEGTGFLGSGEQSRSFGAGDGYIPGEGVGAVLLKPLDKAIADNDTVLAVIRSSFINHSGGRQTYTAPDPKQQTALIANAIERSNIAPETIGYVESAANGSELGDPIEVVALNKAFAQFTKKKQFCSLGSVKSNLGHLEAASGISQLSKVLLQLKHKTLVPTINAKPGNPNIRLANSPFYLQEELSPWTETNDPETGQALPRRAMINSFGAGGAYANLIIEEFLPTILGTEKKQPAKQKQESASEETMQTQLAMVNEQTETASTETMQTLVAMVEKEQNTMEQPESPEQEFYQNLLNRIANGELSEEEFEQLMKE